MVKSDGSGQIMSTLESLKTYYPITLKFFFDDFPNCQVGDEVPILCPMFGHVYPWLSLMLHSFSKLQLSPVHSLSSYHCVRYSWLIRPVCPGCKPILYPTFKFRNASLCDCPVIFTVCTLPINVTWYLPWYIIYVYNGCLNATRGWIEITRCDALYRSCECVKESWIHAIRMFKQIPMKETIPMWHVYTL